MLWVKLESFNSKYLIGKMRCVEECPSLNPVYSQLKRYEVRVCGVAEGFNKTKPSPYIYKDTPNRRR